MKAMTIQPHKAVEGLQEASIPETEKPASMWEKVLVCLFGEREKRVGVPHGVTDVRVHAKRLHINHETGAVAYCYSFGYKAEGVIPEGDGKPYPAEVHTDVLCKLPRTGYYDAMLRVSVNGTVAITIEELEPASA